MMKTMEQEPRAVDRAARIVTGPLPMALRNGGQPVKSLTSAQLFGGASEIEIEHGDSRYRLRVTSLGKLIMTK